MFAIGLVRRFVECGDPIIESSGSIACFYCGKEQDLIDDDELHEEDCVYVEAKEFLASL